MVPCDPSLQVPFLDGSVLPWWAQRERAVAEFSKISVKDAQTFIRVDQQLKTLASYLQPFFLEPPPNPGTDSVAGLGGPATCRQAFPQNFQPRNRGTDFVFDRKSGRISRPQLRVRKDQDAFSRQQRLWQTRRALPARDPQLDCCFICSAEANTSNKDFMAMLWAEWAL